MAEKIDTTHVILDNELIVYRRERSNIWQCRFKVDGTWIRASTKEHNLKKAKAQANELRIVAEIRKRSNLPVITRKFRDVAKLALERMQSELQNGNGKVIYNDYRRVIEEYLIPILGKRLITNIDYAALNELDSKRIEIMKKTPTQSTMLTHNAALNRVFDEAVIRNFLTDANRPKLEAKGKASTRRPSFDLTEVMALLGNFDEWIDRAKTDRSKEMRMILRDYVDVLLDTGARPGDELLNLKWRQITVDKKPVITATNSVDENGEVIELANLNRSLELTISGKTGTRTIVAMLRTVKAFERIAKRNYDNKDNVATPFKSLIVPSNNDYVIRMASKELPPSLPKMFDNYLEEHNLLIDSKTEQKRVLYSLRHTYATLALTNDKVPIHTLSKQMGTSVKMIEKHYSHLKVVQAIEQLRGEETRKLIDAGGVIDKEYTSKRKSKAAT
jgi:integrase